MDFSIIDAHAHLWLRQDTLVNGKRVRQLADGRCDFMGEERQMLPPFMIDGKNSAEVFLSNMNYARVSAAVIVQEFIDGNQNEYLKEVSEKYTDRFFVNGMPDYDQPDLMGQVAELLDSGFRGITLPAHRLPLEEGNRVWLNSERMMAMFKEMERRDAILTVTLADGACQVDEMKEVIRECPNLKIAVGHFGMVTTDGWLEQIKLAEYRNVYVESGGITWLFNDEFYPFEGAVKAIRTAADMVGIEKLMWGSDYPRTITAITYKMSYDFIMKSELLTESEKKAFLGENACGFYGFKNPVVLPYIKNMSE